MAFIVSFAMIFILVFITQLFIGVFSVASHQINQTISNNSNKDYTSTTISQSQSTIPSSSGLAQQPNASSPFIPLLIMLLVLLGLIFWYTKIRKAKKVN